MGILRHFISRGNLAANAADFGILPDVALAPYSEPELVDSLDCALDAVSRDDWRALSSILASDVADYQPICTRCGERGCECWYR